MSPEDYEQLAATLARKRNPAATDAQITAIVSAHVGQERAAGVPLWQYSSAELIREYCGHALDSLQRSHPDLFAILPTPSEYVTRAIESGQVLSPEQKLSMAREVEVMEPKALLRTFNAMGEKITARQKPLADTANTSAIDRYKAKLREDDEKRIAKNQDAHRKAERARMADSDFNDLSPAARLNIARRAAQNRG